MTADQLATKYPLIWHMADPRNAAGILQRGLLSTSALLDALGIPKERRTAYERERRPTDLLVSSDIGETAVLRDQKPLIVSRLEKALTGCSVADFLAHINQRVFFWPTLERLSTMSNARAYANRPQLVLVVRTRDLIYAYEAAVRLSRINSGSTMPYAVPRSLQTFKTLAEYDWCANRRGVAEITVEGGVPDIWQFVDRCETWMNGNYRDRLDPPYDATLTERVR